MWLFTPFGYFSIVEKPQDRASHTLTVRARYEGDLENLRQRYLPELSATRTSPDNDYAYRATVDRAQLAQAMAQITLDLNYSNFKDAVTDTQGHDRHRLYLRVWSVLKGAQRQLSGLRSTRTQERRRAEPGSHRQTSWDYTWGPVNDTSWNDDMYSDDTHWR